MNFAGAKYWGLPGTVWANLAFSVLYLVTILYVVFILNAPKINSCVEAQTADSPGIQPYRSKR